MKVVGWSAASTSATSALLMLERSVEPVVVSDSIRRLPVTAPSLSRPGSFEPRSRSPSQVTACSGRSMPVGMGAPGTVCECITRQMRGSSMSAPTSGPLQPARASASEATSEGRAVVTVALLVEIEDEPDLHVGYGEPEARVGHVAHRQAAGSELLRGRLGAMHRQPDAREPAAHEEDEPIRVAKLEPHLRVDEGVADLLQQRPHAVRDGGEAADA